jgi:predicted metal-dependent hydrolase
MDIGDDPRFAAGIAHFNRGDYFDAAESFEDLFFEAVRGELDLARALLQVASGMHHVERGQRRAAIERLEEALEPIDRVEDDRGVDLVALRADVARAIAQLRKGERVKRIRLTCKSTDTRR